MAEQLRDPGGIFDIGFPARHRLDGLRIYHEQFELAFQQIIDRTPVLASRNVANGWGCCLKMVAQKSD